MNRSRLLIYLLFFASGASGLIYEVVWVRQFGLLFGSTVYSAAMVTSIYMSGLGLGSYLAGRWVDRRVRSDPRAPVRAYGLFELGIALLAGGILLAIPSIAGFAADVSSYVVEENGWRRLSPASSAVRYGCAIVLLTPITLLMGGTLTLLIRHLVGDDVASAGRHVGVLYGINTAGAALGCILTDTALVPAFGLRSTQLLAIGLNLFAAGGALLLARRVPALATTATTPPAVHRRREPVVAWVGLAIGLSGFAAMAMQILWFRHLISLLGSYRPVFSILLTVILVGIWLGSLLGGVLSSRTGRPATIFAAALAGFVLWALGALWLVAPADEAVFLEVLADPEGGPLPFYLHLLEQTTWVVGPPALMTGMAYPLANAVVQRASERVGERAGLLYLSNTVGGVMGSLLAGFVLLPAIGIQGTATLVIVVVLGAMLAVSMAARGSEPSAWAPRVAAFAAALLAAGLWYRLPERALLMHTLPEQVSNGQVELLALREGVNETLAITDYRGISRTLLTNGHSMSGTDFPAQRYMRAYMHVPMFLTDRIENVMVMCFGVGNTANAVLMYPTVQRLDVVDLSRDILEHSRHFEPVNGLPLEDPRVRVHVNDARHHLRMKSDVQYDLITGEPPPIAQVGVASLYTREFFQLAKARLRTGGFVTYWLPMNQIGEDVARSTVAAFLEEFPGAFLLSGYRHQLMLVGRKDAPLSFDPEVMRRRMEEVPGLRRDLRMISLEEPFHVAAMLAASPETMASATRGVAPLADDRPMMEYGSRLTSRHRRLPADLFSVEDLASWCPRCFEGALSPAERRDLEGALDLVDQYYRSPAFLAHQPGLVKPFKPRVDARARRAVNGHFYFEELIGRAWRPTVLAFQQLRHGKETAAVATLQRFAKRHPERIAERIDLADLYRDRGHLERARRELEAIQALAPDEPRVQAAWQRLEHAQAQ